MVFAGICLVTRDVRRLSAFYKSILRTTSDCDDELHQEVITEGAMLAILKNDDIRISGNSNMSLAFTVPDVDIDFERLQALGVPIIDPPTTRPWGARNMRFSDPDGNYIVFRSFPRT